MSNVGVSTNHERIHTTRPDSLKRLSVAKGEKYKYIFRAQTHLSPQLRSLASSIPLASMLLLGPRPMTSLMLTQMPLPGPCPMQLPSCNHHDTISHLTRPHLPTKTRPPPPPPPPPPRPPPPSPPRHPYTAAAKPSAPPSPKPSHSPTHSPPPA